MIYRYVKNEDELELLLSEIEDKPLKLIAVERISDKKLKVRFEKLNKKEFRSKVKMTSEQKKNCITELGRRIKNLSEDVKRIEKMQIPKWMKEKELRHKIRNVKYRIESSIRQLEKLTTSYDKNMESIEMMSRDKSCCNQAIEVHKKDIQKYKRKK